MIEPTGQSSMHQRPVVRTSGLLWWAVLCVAMIAVVGIGILTWQLTEARNEISRLSSTADDHSQRIKSVKADVSTLQNDMSAIQVDVSATQANVSTLQAVTAIPTSRSLGPYVVYCGTGYGSQRLPIETPMCRVTFDFSVAGSATGWFVVDGHSNLILSNETVVVRAGGGSFVATEPGDYQFVFWCSSSTTPSTVTLNCTVHPPAPVVAGS